MHLGFQKIQRPETGRKRIGILSHLGGGTSRGRRAGRSGKPVCMLTKNSHPGHELETFLFYHTLVPSLSKISPFSPLFLHTHRQGPRRSCRGPLLWAERDARRGGAVFWSPAAERLESSQNVHEVVMILPFFSGMITVYPEDKNNISHFSLSFTTHTAESPGHRPGLFVPSGWRNHLQNVQEEDMILPCFSGMITVYQEDRIISPFSPSLFQNTHSRRPRSQTGAFCGKMGWKFTKCSRQRHDSAMFLRYDNTVARKQNCISHFSLSFTTHTSKGAPARCRGPLLFYPLRPTAPLSRSRRFIFRLRAAE